MKPKHKIGIIGAMPQEIDGVVALLHNPSQVEIGMRKYHSGEINGVPAVVVFSRWGKVATAMTVSALIHHFGVTEIIFTGVAGAVSKCLNIGDIVVGSRFIQHDMDGRPFMARFEIPLLGKTFIEAPAGAVEAAQKAVNKLFETKNLSALFGEDILKSFNITKPKLVTGDIASGDLFFDSTAQKQALAAALPSVLCVEMEGAALAQVCYEHNIPFCVIRTIADSAGDSAHIEFAAFIEKISSTYHKEIIKYFVKFFEEQPSPFPLPERVKGK